MRAVTLFTQVLVAIAVLMGYLYFRSEDTHSNLGNLKSLGSFDRIFEKKSQSWVQEEFDQWHDCITKNLSVHRGDPDKVGPLGVNINATKSVINSLRLEGLGINRCKKNCIKCQNTIFEHELSEA